MKDEKGLAMVLAITLLGLLSSFGLYLILDSGATFRITKAQQRSEQVFDMADAALGLGLRCISNSTPSPTYEQLTSEKPLPIQTGLPGYMDRQTFAGGTITPNVDYVGHRTTPPPGWMLNWQGYSSFYGLYFRSRGNAQMTIPGAQGNAQSHVLSFALKVIR